MAAPTGTGGFVSRAEKGSLSLLAATPDNLGPGSYELARSPSSYPAPAPFHTSDEKNGFSANTHTPGVGAYDTAYAHDALTTRHVDPIGHTNNFCSTVPRLKPDSTKAFVPGPGAYEEGNAWLKRSHRYEPPSPKQRICYQKSATAPSIPATSQSFGYEEGAAGELVAQRPVDHVHTGEGFDKVGPGSYNITSPSVGNSSKAVAWGKSKARRDAGLPKGSAAPGPGYYNPQPASAPANSPIIVSVNGVDVQFGGATGSSQFVSKVPLKANRQVQEREVTPGPGQYSVDPGLAAKYTQGPPKEMQFFGATSRRASQIDPTKSLSAPTYFKNPGPGAYEESRRAVNVTKSLSDPQPFLCTTSRFKSDNGGLPGPGEYRPDYIQTMAKDIEDKALISRGGVFGSTATRFASKSASSQPGPGNYEPLLERHRVNTSNEMSTFTSKTRRFSPTRAPAASIYTSDQSLTAQGIVKGDPARIGPGSYAEQDVWSKKQYHPGYQKAAFGTGGQRHDITTSTTPGPGRYNDSVDVNKVYRPYSVPARNTVFGVQADRFKSTGNFTPGPGHYSTSGDVVKKSFNITFAGHGEA